SAVPARLRCESSVLLGLIEVAVLTVERQGTPVVAVRACELLGDLDAVPEALRGAPQLELRVDVEPARDVDGREQHVAELLGSTLRRVEVVLQLPYLVLEVGESSFDRRVLEADSPCALLHLPGVQKRGERFRHVMEHTLPPFLLPLDSIPVLLDPSRRRRLDVAEHVRVPADELVVDEPRS